MADILLITGLSGAGRSQAADVLEDLGWFVVDNMPVELVDKFVELAGASAEGSRLALVVGVAAQQQDAIAMLPRLRQAGHHVRVLFLDAATSVLVKRYTESRRKHPLRQDSGTLSEVIEHERRLLEPIRLAADKVLDTSNLAVAQFKRQMTDLFGAAGSDDDMQLAVVSFGFKHGLPLDVDCVFDVRFLPNPHYEPKLAPLTGRDRPVIEFLERVPEVEEMYGDIQGFVSRWLPAFVRDNRNYLTVAIGCTGGQHRSVWCAQELAPRFRRTEHVLVRHRGLALRGRTV